MSSGSFECKSVTFSIGEGCPDYYLSDSQSDYEDTEYIEPEEKKWSKEDGPPSEEMLRRWQEKLLKLQCP